MVFFTAFVPERVIFRGHPAMPYLTALPAAGVALYAGEPWPSPLVSAGLWALGVLAWTLFEYLLHRFVFHWPAKSEVGRVVCFVAHGHHHVAPRERSRLAATPVQMVSALVLLAGLFRLALGAAWTLAFAGAATGYAAYEAIHYLAHHGRVRNPLLKTVVRHHLLHHHRTPDWRFGNLEPALGLGVPHGWPR